MPRAGSGWYYNLTNDLMLANGCQDARQIRQRFHLQNILTEVNCNIGALTPRRLLAVLLPSLLGNTFVIKAHAGPTPLARWLIQRGQMRTAYIFRDPRDAMLSAFENGQRARQQGRSNAFSGLGDFETALGFMMDYLVIWEAWMAIEEVLHARYEEMLRNYESESGCLIKFLELDEKSAQIQDVVAKYRPEKAQEDQIGLHFSKGMIGRFRQKWDDEQQAILAEQFSPYLEQMGFPV
jgi:hypothetical protein